MGDVVEIIILRKSADEDNRFVYPQQAAEFAISLAGSVPTADERSQLESVCRELLDKLGL